MYVRIYICILPCFVYMKRIEILLYCDESEARNLESLTRPAVCFTCFTFPPSLAWLLAYNFFAFHQLHRYNDFSPLPFSPTQPFTPPKPQPNLRTILQQLHRPHDRRARRQRTIRKRRPLRARRRLALQRRRPAIRHPLWQGKGERADGLAPGEGDVRVA